MSGWVRKIGCCLHIRRSFLFYCIKKHENILDLDFVIVQWLRDDDDDDTNNNNIC